MVNQSISERSLYEHLCDLRLKKFIRNAIAFDENGNHNASQVIENQLLEVIDRSYHMW